MTEIDAEEKYTIFSYSEIVVVSANRNSCVGYIIKIEITCDSTEDEDAWLFV